MGSVVCCGCVVLAAHVGCCSHLSIEIKYLPAPFLFSTLLNHDRSQRSLGQEVRTLVNEKLGSGSYETTFDVTGLASGVYFYRLQARLSSSSVGGQAGQFVETKKLMLLR
ncbi:MAG: hypothetical protein HW412_837 [Bacteroidetes bacterium]|nr:hypothetical protein [Bacteroidota bacterium]